MSEPGAVATGPFGTPFGRVATAPRSDTSEIALKETLLNIALAVAILVGSYVIMHFFARAMYVRCFACGTLNARRRVVCRQCGDQLKK